MTRVGLVGVWVLALATSGCAAFGPAPRAEPFRISHVVGAGDAARRASTRLVLGGLDAEAEGNASRGRSLFERALQVDPTNPYAFLALARSAEARGDATQGVHFLEQAEVLLRLEDAPAGALMHATGLRGALGDAAALREAERAFPGVWADGRLDALELR